MKFNLYRTYVYLVLFIHYTCSRCIVLQIEAEVRLIMLLEVFQYELSNIKSDWGQTQNTLLGYAMIEDRPSSAPSGWFLCDSQKVHFAPRSASSLGIEIHHKKRGFLNGNGCKMLSISH